MGFWQRWRQRRREAARQIFGYWDGSRERRIDPMKAARGFDAHPRFNLSKHLALVEKDDPEAIAITLEAVRDVFDVKEWTEATPGLTQIECLALFRAFGDYIEDLKKKLNPSQTFTPPTDQELSTPEPLPTPSTSDFGPISTESNYAEQPAR